MSDGTMRLYDTARREVVPFDPALRDHFRRLNQQWLERHFRVEGVDRTLFADPEGLIIAPGGAIFFARYAGEVVGTCALIRESEGVFELSKMGVDENFRGLGAGRALLDAAIAEYRRRGGKELFLESNSRLDRALADRGRGSERREEPAHGSGRGRRRRGSASGTSHGSRGS